MYYDDFMWHISEFSISGHTQSNHIKMLPYENKSKTKAFVCNHDEYGVRENISSGREAASQTLHGHINHTSINVRYWWEISAYDAIIYIMSRLDKYEIFYMQWITSYAWFIGRYQSDFVFS